MGQGKYILERKNAGGGGAGKAGVPQWPKLEQFEHKISNVVLDYSPKYKIKIQIDIN